MLTTFDADEYVLRALRAGASGFLLKDTPPAEIVHAVRRVAAGEPMLSPRVTRQLIAHVTDAGLDARRDPRAGRCSTGSASGSARSRSRSARAGPTPRSAPSCS